MITDARAPHGGKPEPNPVHIRDFTIRASADVKPPLPNAFNFLWDKNARAGRSLTIGTMSSR